MAPACEAVSGRSLETAAADVVVDVLPSAPPFFAVIAFAFEDSDAFGPFCAPAMADTGRSLDAFRWPDALFADPVVEGVVGLGMAPPRALPVSGETTPLCAGFTPKALLPVAEPGFAAADPPLTCLAFTAVPMDEVAWLDRGLETVPEEAIEIAAADDGLTTGAALSWDIVETEVADDCATAAEEFEEGSTTSLLFVWLLEALLLAAIASVVALVVDAIMKNLNKYCTKNQKLQIQ